MLQHQKDENKRHAQTALQCQSNWEKASDVSEHSYLKKKGIQSYGLRQAGSLLIIPISIDGQLTSFQTIAPDGYKKFETGGAIKGGHHIIGDTNCHNIIIGEGYATMATLHEATKYCSIVAFNAGNLKAVSENIHKRFPDKNIIIAADDDKWLSENVGLIKATEAAKSIHAFLIKPEFESLDSKPTDFNDLHALQGIDSVKKQIEASLHNSPDELIETPDEIISRLSVLSPVEYESIRIEEAKNLGFRTSVLDKMVSQSVKESEKDDEVVSSDSPYPEFVDGLNLLSDIEESIPKHMILPIGALTAIVLWLVATYVYNAFRIFPKLAIISPEKRCGKSTLLDILAAISSRSLIASNITPSAIFRAVDLWKPTLIIDEADTFISGRNDDLIGIVNSGHTKTTAFVIRTVGDDHTPKKFSTWAPMALASIGGLTGTVMDRSIVINLRRRASSETVRRLPIDFREDCSIIRQRVTRWAQDNESLLKAIPVEPPAIPNDRAMDNWLPLFTIAHAIGGDWPEKVESSYFTLNSMEEEETAAVMLLRDVQLIFEENNTIKIFTRTLILHLIQLEERPWSEWRRGSPMTQNSLAKILKTFSIKSKKIRIDQATAMGYESSSFTDSFSRYLPPRIT